MPADTSRAVFLSYASQDAGAALGICEALRRAGVEVWFDQSELRGGDAWDAKIRGQIASCALFVPVISANTQARHEGYFRLEWKLAAQRTHMMSGARAFLLPVVIDATRDAEAHVPAEFRTVQWTRLDLSLPAVSLSNPSNGLRPVGFGGQAPDAASVAEKFSARVKQLLDGSIVGGALRRDDDARPRESGHKSPLTAERRALWLGGAMLGVVAVVGFAIWQPWRKSERATAHNQAGAIEPANETGAGARHAPSAPLEKSVAVLAFENKSDDRANELFSDALSEDLIGELGRVPGLTVKGWTSSLFLKNKNLPTAEIGRQLGVTYIVRGRVQKSANQVQITAQLSRAATDQLVWSSEPLVRDLKDVWALQSEIAGLIASQLSLTLGNAPRAAAPPDPAAHRLYLEGRYFWSLRTEEGFARSQAAFEKAIALSPTYGQAHAGLADLCMVRGWYHLEGSEPIVPDFVRARAEAARALELDPNLAEPHATLGVIALVTRHPAEGERLIRKTINLAPNYATAHNWLAEAMLIQGRLDVAVREFCHAADLEPLSPVMLNDCGKVLLMAGRPAEALVYLEREHAINPGAGACGVRRAEALLALGRKAEAAAVLQPALPRLLSGEHTFMAGQAVYVLKGLGLDDEAKEFGGRMIERLEPRDTTRGLILMAQGRTAEALPALSRTFAVNFEQEFWHPMFDPVREDARFAELIARLDSVESYQVARATLARLKREKGAKP